MERIFTNKAISLATFIGGPLSAGILISKNYKVFGDEESAKKAMYLGIISTLIVFAIIFLIPEHIMGKIPNALFPAIYTLIITLLVNKFQGNQIKRHLENNGLQASYWVAAGYGSIGLVVIIVFIFSMIFLFNSNGYKNKIEIQNGVVLYYNDFDFDKTNKIVQAIKYSRFMEASEGSDLFLINEDSVVKLGFVLPSLSSLSDTLITNDFNNFERFLNYNLNFDKKIKFYFTDTELKNKTDLPKVTSRIIGYEPALYLQPNKINQFQTIYSNCFTPYKDIQKVILAINNSKGYFTPNKPLDIIFLNQDSYYDIKFFVIKAFWEDQRILKALNSTVDYINYLGVKKKIKIRLIDNMTFEEKQI
jgi:hypothetical protein